MRLRRQFGYIPTREIIRGKFTFLSPWNNVPLQDHYKTLSATVGACRWRYRAFSQSCSCGARVRTGGVAVCIARIGGSLSTESFHQSTLPQKRFNEHEHCLLVVDSIGGALTECVLKRLLDERRKEDISLLVCCENFCIPLLPMYRMSAARCCAAYHEICALRSSA